MEPKKRVPDETRSKLALMGALTSYLPGIGEDRQDVRVGCRQDDDLEVGTIDWRQDGFYSGWE